MQKYKKRGYRPNISDHLLYEGDVRKVKIVRRPLWFLNPCGGKRLP